MEMWKRVRNLVNGDIVRMTTGNWRIVSCTREDSPFETYMIRMHHANGVFRNIVLWGNFPVPMWSFAELES